MSDSVKLVPLEPPATVPAVFVASPELESGVRDYVAAAAAPNTVRAKESDWRLFSSWCSSRDLPALPAEPATLAAFLSDQSLGAEGRPPKAVASILRYASSISSRHDAAGFPSPLRHPAVKATLEGIQKSRGVRTKKKYAFTVSLLRQALPIGDEVSAVRDRAVLLFGLATACRRSEISAVNVEDVRWIRQGAIITIQRSKTDQRGEGKQVALPRLAGTDGICPCETLQRWLDIRGSAPGPLFLSLRIGGALRGHRLPPETICIITKQAAARAGLDPALFGAHSLRAGYVTSARERGMAWAEIMEQTGHSTLKIVKGYSHYTEGIFEATHADKVWSDVAKVTDEEP